MKVLILNPGSASLRFAVISAEPPDGDQIRGSELLSGVLEPIGGNARLNVQANGNMLRDETVPVTDHKEAARQVFARMQWTAADFDLMALRVVQGGDRYTEPVLINSQVLSSLEELEDLAPLHNAGSVAVFRAFQQTVGTGLPAVAIFDSSFHRTIPPVAFTYGIPHELAAKHKIRRYGFHGISHHYLMLRYAEITGTPVVATNIITMHLGGGCSAAAIQNGASIDTSMGFTPLEGLVMGTRSGDIDPALVGFLARKENVSVGEVERWLNTQSGVLGISGVSKDMRVLEERAKTDERARLALDVFCYRARKYIGAYLAVLKDAAAIVFSGGIGEHSSGIRHAICEGLEHLGLDMDPSRNAQAKGERRITRDGSRLHAYVIPTDEGLMMAHLALRWHASSRTGSRN